MKHYSSLIVTKNNGVPWQVERIWNVSKCPTPIHGTDWRVARSSFLGPGIDFRKVRWKYASP